VTLRPVEQALLALVDGRRTVAEIATAAHASEFDATKILYHLAEAGYVEAVAERAASVDPSARQEAIARGMNDALRAVVAAVPEPARSAFHASVRGYLADARSPFAPVFARLVPAPDGALEEAALLSNVRGVEPGVVAGGPAALLLDALRELLFFYLFLAGERIDRAADDALGRTVKRRLAAVEDLV